MGLKSKIYRSLPLGLQKKVGKLYFNVVSNNPAKDYNDKRYNDENLKAQIQNTYNLAKKKFSNKQIIIVSNINFNFDVPCKVIKDLNNINTTDNIFIPIFENDEETYKIVKEINKRHGKFYSLTIHYPVAKYIYKDINCRKAMLDTVKDTAEYNIPQFDEKDFETICQALKVTKDLEGDYLELGVFMGASGLVALNYLKHSKIKRQCYFIDTYEGFNFQEAKEDCDTCFEGTHNLGDPKKLMKKIEDMYKNKNVPFKLVKANICSDDLPKEIKKLALCNIDVDSYEPVRDSIKKVSPLIVTNGIIILEDFGHTPALSGADLASREFLETDEGKKYTPIYLNSGQLMLIKK